MRISFTKGGVSGSYDGKTISMRGAGQAAVNAIKVAYSKDVLEEKATKYISKGWYVTKSSNGRKLKLSRQAPALRTGA